jgi:hypothetical protein
MTSVRFTLYGPAAKAILTKENPRYVPETRKYNVTVTLVLKCVEGCDKIEGEFEI